MLNYTLGTIEASEALIKDLYIDLRAKVNAWSKITQQTPQARMGYVGQHLVSVVTGYPGGKSGARGYDLIALTESVDEQLSELPQRRILQDREAAEEKLRELERYPSKPCFMCVNARVDDELTDDNDFSSIGVGRAMKGYRLSINSGNRSPVSIEVEAWNEQMQRNTIVASYHPKFCPNCGRRLFEYEEVNENERRNDS